MNSHVPSYLFKNRFGIFHFRGRIPKHIRKKYHIQKQVVQKSLGTSNRSKAIKLAKVWWVRMKETDYLNKLDQQVENNNDVLEEGRRILAELNSLADKPECLSSDINEFLISLSPYQEKALKYANEHFSNIPPKHPLRPLHILQNQASTHTSPKPAITLSEAYDEYYQWKKQDWGNDAKRKSRAAFQQLLNCVSDKRCSELTIHDLINFKNILIKLPSRVDLGIYKGKTYSEICSMDIPDNKVASKDTLKKKFGYVSQFLDACEDDGYICIDHRKPFKNFSKKRKNKNSKIRMGYTPEELNRLFGSKEYTQGSHKSPAHHWVPLIGLFTGARLNEICQLHKQDIKQDKNSQIWYFDFNEDKEGSSIKTDASLRFIPIHGNLKKLGFFKYIATLDDHDRLFPMLTTNTKGIYSDSISKWFNRTYKKNCGIVVPIGKMKDFHSFRNTVINTLKQNGIPVASAKEIAGHEDKDMTYGKYAEPTDLPNKKKIISKITYPSINFAKIRRLKW